MYKQSMNFPKSWQKYVDFREGRQWPPINEETKDFPRPVSNIITYIIQHKTCSVLTSNVKMVFVSSEADNTEAEQQSTIFTNYSEVVYEQIKQDKINEEMIDNAAMLGTGIVHYYWDNNISGGMKNPYVGQIQGEIIDVNNFFPGNPQERDTQKQPYIIITSRDIVENIKELAKNNGTSADNIMLITADKADNDTYLNNQTEVDGTDKATIITKYWKENGIVNFCKCCSGVTIQEKTNTKAKHYPIALMNWFKRKDCIFGISETESLIPSQTAINFLMAMQIYNAQLNGMPRMVVNPTMIGQTITNRMGEIIYEDDMGTGKNGIRYLQPPNMTAQQQTLVDTVMEYAKVLSGATETSTGELKGGSQMNATAINLLQQAAAIPIDGIKKRYYQFLEDVALIWEDFYKNYITIDRTFITEDNGEKVENVINGESVQGMDFNLKIEITEESAYSESNIMQSLQQALDSDHITYEQFLKYAPKSMVPYKDSLLKDITEQNAMQTTIQGMTDMDRETINNLPQEQKAQAIKQMSQVGNNNIGGM